MSHTLVVHYLCVRVHESFFLYSFVWYRVSNVFSLDTIMLLYLCSANGATEKNDTPRLIRMTIGPTFHRRGFLCSAFVAMAPYTFLSVLYVAHLGQSISWASFPQYHHSSSEVSTLSQWFLSSSQIDGPVYFSRLMLFSSSIRTASWHIQAPSPQNVIKS